MMEKSKTELATEALAILTALEGKLREEGPEVQQDIDQVQYFQTSLRIMRNSWLDHARVSFRPDDPSAKG